MANGLPIERLLSEKEVKDRFNLMADMLDEFNILVTVVKLPTGALEVITNHDNLESKIEYLQNAYDDEFKLKNNSDVQIVDFIIY